MLNPEQADVMMYAGVVECRNLESFGKEYDNYYTDYIGEVENCFGIY